MAKFVQAKFFVLCIVLILSSFFDADSWDFSADELAWRDNVDDEVHMVESRHDSSARSCKIADGKWIYDQSYPLYDSTSCPYLTTAVACRKNGRPDSDYEKWRWKPHDCSIPRFDALAFLGKMRRKRIMLVGDSIMRNQWESLVCLTQSVVPAARKTVTYNGPTMAFHALDFEMTIEFSWAPLLVELKKGPRNKRILHLDQIEENAKHWRGVDVLVFDSAHWWTHSDKTRSWDFLMEANNVYRYLNPMDAYERGLSTWAKWVDSNLDPRKTRVIFRSMSPRHNSQIPETSNKPQPPSVQTELIMLSLPAIAGQAIEPLAQLMETAYIGRLGSLELASAGVSISIFNIISKVFNIPLLSVATSFVAEDISKHSIDGSTSSERKQLPSVSTALLLSVGIGIIEATALYLGSGMFLSIMGISTASPMRISAQHFLQLRAIGCPAVVLSLAIQGIFRGFKDTKTPVQCLGLGNMAAVFFFPILMYVFGLGVTGAAISTVLSQYIVTLSMIWHLNKRTALVPNLEKLQFGGYLKSGGFLLGRTLAAVLTVTLSTSMAARQGPLSMAAHQIILQVWLSVSLLADAQSSSSQALVASSFAKGDYIRVKEITYICIKAGLFTGILLAIILSLSFGSLATLFTNDVEVLRIVRSGLLFISASQPITALAYIFDGLHYGISDFMFAACSMMLVGAMSSVFLLYAPPLIGLSGVWSGLTLFMALRTVAGFMRLSSKNGPWWFLHDVREPETEIAV